jgi:hypothetical protein
VSAPRRATRIIGRDTWPLADKAGGLLVTSDQPIMVERVLYCGDGNGSATYGSTASAFHS